MGSGKVSEMSEGLDAVEWRGCYGGVRGDLFAGEQCASSEDGGGAVLPDIRVHGRAGVGE